MTATTTTTTCPSWCVSHDSDGQHLGRTWHLDLLDYALTATPRSNVDDCEPLGYGSPSLALTIVDTEDLDAPPMRIVLEPEPLARVLDFLQRARHDLDDLVEWHHDLANGATS